MIEKQNEDLIELSEIYRKNPMFLGEIKENYPELFSTYQSRYRNKGNFKAFLRDYNLYDLYEKLFYDTHIKPRIRTEEIILEDIRRLSKKISKKYNGIIPLRMYANKDTRKLAELVSNYHIVANKGKCNVECVLDFLKNKGYQIQKPEDIEKCSLKDVEDYLLDKNISKKYKKVDIRNLKPKLDRFARDLDLELFEMMELLGYSLIKLDSNYYKQKITDLYNNTDRDVLFKSTTKEYRSIVYLCSRYNQDKKWQEVLKDLGLDI